MKKFISFQIIFICFLMVGCSESNFDLASDSRLPKWFELPKERSRADLKITIDYYVNPNGRAVVFKMFDREHTFFPIKKVKGELKGLEPIHINNSLKSGSYPSYEIVTMDGVTEVIEHRKPEPFFYIVDDPAILSELGVKTN